MISTPNPMSLIGELLPGDGLTADEFTSECKKRGILARIEGNALTVTTKSNEGWLRTGTFNMPAYSDGTYEPGVIILLQAWATQYDVSLTNK